MTSPYDPDTIARLVARHGTDRTADIIAGRDAATNRDMASWTRVGALGETPAAKARRRSADRDALILKLYRSGIHPELIGERVGLSAEVVARVLRPVFGGLGRGQSR